MTHATISVARVKDLCDFRIKVADESLQKDFNDLIEARRYPWWRRALGLPPRTPERAMELLEAEPGFDSPLRMIEQRREWSTEDARRLLSAAWMSERQTMMVDSEDAVLLESWSVSQRRRAQATTQTTTVAA